MVNIIVGSCHDVGWLVQSCTVRRIAAASVEAVSSGWILGIYQQLPDSRKSVLVL